jgi:hypothetical protein
LTSLVNAGKATGAAWRSITEYLILMPNKDRRPSDDATYSCDSSGEEIVVPIDLTAGSRQEYVEDCPVCCCPSVIHVEIDDEGDVPVWAERE